MKNTENAPILEASRQSDELLLKEGGHSAKRYISSRAKEEFPESPTDTAEQTILGNMMANYSLLEPLYDLNAVDMDAESICTVAIPVAILSEDLDKVSDVIDKIKHSKDDSSRPLDVVLWANARHEENNKEEVELRASVQYEKLIEKLKLITDEDMRIKTALKLIPNTDFSMSKLRSDYMDAVVIDSLENDHGFNHPVLWMDADTTRISKQSISLLADSVSKVEALFVHANLQYSVDWASEALPDELDDSTKAVILNEMQQRYLYAFGENEATRTYPEESGLMFSLGVYMNAGGVDKTRPIGESGGLIRRAKRVKFDVTNDDDGILPPSVDQRRGLDLPLVKYIQAARMGVSARRHYEVAKQKGAEGLFDVDSSGYGDDLYTDIEKVNVTNKITKADMQNLSERNHAKWEKNKVQVISYDADGQRIPETQEQRLAYAKKARNKKIADKLIDRYFTD